MRLSAVAPKGRRLEVAAGGGNLGEVDLAVRYSSN